ncbi:MAG: hypothetical protein R3Y23_02920, partial [Bacillota bacterium]
MKNKYIRLLVVILLIGVLALTLGACSTRGENTTDGNISNGNDEVEDASDDRVYTSSTEALEMLAEAVQNSNDVNEVMEEAEWFVIDTQVDFIYEHYENGTSYNYTVVLKANFNVAEIDETYSSDTALSNNYKSTMLLELWDNDLGALGLGVYYYSGTLYINYMGSEYKASEINIATLGDLVGGLLVGSGIDIPQLLIGWLTADTGIEMVDGILAMILGQLIVSGSDTGIITTYNNGANQDVVVTVALNTLLDILSGTLGSMISWDSFGLPDFDGVMMQLLGFNIEWLKTTDWPDMSVYYGAVTTWSDEIPVLETNEDGDSVQSYDENGNPVYTSGYVFDGLTISVTTPTNSTYQTEEVYMADITITPFVMGMRDTKTTIDFSSYGLTDSSRYDDGGILNLELGATLYLQNKIAGAELTLNDILGTVLDLGSVGEIPILFPEASIYAFGLDLRLDFDFFDDTQTKFELSITYNNAAFLRVYYENNVIYVNCEAIADTTGQIIPNIKIDLNLNEMLSSITDMLSAYIDPDYIAPDPTADSASNANDELSNASLDVMDLLEFILSCLDLPRKDPYDDYGTITLALDTDALNELLAMFVDLDGGIGLDSIVVSLDQTDIIDSFSAVINFNEDVTAGLQIDNLSWFASPEFQNAEMIDTQDELDTYVDLWTETEYKATITGNFNISLLETTDGVDLSGLIGLFLDEIMLTLGVEEDMDFTINYTLMAIVDLADISAIDLGLTFYLNDDPSTQFLFVRYTGSNDTLYLDLSSFDNLSNVLTALQFIDDLPAISIPDIGLSSLLSGITIIDSTSTLSNLSAYSTGYTFTSPETFMVDLSSAMYASAGSLVANESEN